VITTKRVIETVCPAELALPIPERVAKVPGASITFNDLGQGYFSAHMKRENLLEGRLVDAAKACPKPP
jgi:hypothetical protein